MKHLLSLTLALSLSVATLPMQAAAGGMAFDMPHLTWPQPTQPTRDCADATAPTPVAECAPTQ